MFIVVEGPDGAGKTTLIEKIRQNLKRYFWILRPSHPPVNLSEINGFISSLERKVSSLDLLMDRHPYISEPIYGPILRGVDLLGFKDNYRELAQGARGHFVSIDPNPLLIYCRPPTGLIEHNVEKSAAQQLEGVPDHIARIAVEYDRYMRELRPLMNVVTYDYTVPESFTSLMSRLSQLR